MINNIIVECLTPEHGKRIIKAFNDLGIDTRSRSGCCCKTNIYRFYGVVNHVFNNYTNANLAGVKLLTIDELERLTKVEEDKEQYPKVMFVSDDGICWKKRVVFMEKNGYFLAWHEAETFEEAKLHIHVNGWKYAKECNPNEVTMQEIADKFGINIKDLKIKK